MDKRHISPSGPVFLGSNAEASLKHFVLGLADTLRLNVFLGSNAEASLKQDFVQDRDQAVSVVFLGSNAEASLKQDRPSTEAFLDRMSSSAVMPRPH